MCLQAETAEPLIYYVGDSYSGRGWGAGGAVGVFRVVHLLCQRGSTHLLSDRIFTETHMKGKMAPCFHICTRKLTTRETQTRLFYMRSNAQMHTMHKQYYIKTASSVRYTMQRTRTRLPFPH